ncbi:MAG: Gfo/Idh/MocA family oxidoreductase [Abditibacteriaceae bacterium]
MKELKIAIIGASGIGKNHAKWFDKHGCNVTCFLGSSPITVQQTTIMLEENFGIRAKGFWKIDELLIQPLDAVCVASPPAVHYEHVKACLSANLPVLCEKPLIYDANLSTAEMTGQANELTALAKQRKVLLGMQMQYAMIAETLLEMAGAGSLRRFEMIMETKSLKPGRDFEQIWIELAPHPLSVLQQLVGSDASLENISCNISAMETQADFIIKASDGNAITARITTRCAPETPTPMRRFILNDCVIDYSGRNNAKGQFRSYLATNENEVELTDFVDLLVGNFIATYHGSEQLKVTGAHGAQNVAWMLQVLNAGKRIS